VRGEQDDMFALIRRLFPICRSITGNGVRETLRIMREQIPLDIHEVPSGTKVFDWIVPDEWNIEDAWISRTNGEAVVDFKKLNLHVVSYSTPIESTVSLEELRKHVYTLPDHPDWVPYRTSYYKRDWGFCMAHKQLQSLQDREYRVSIQSSLAPGSLTYGELYLPGRRPEEVLISCHICHPSLCNDNLSGIALAVSLAKRLQQLELEYSYRFLFIPGTIGSITWLALNSAKARDIRHGLVVTGVGGPGNPTYKKSRRGNAEIDRAAEHILGHAGAHTILEFTPYGYDERQYCSPGFDLAVGSLTRMPHATYPEYHTSADNLDFVKAEFLSLSLALYADVIGLIERNKTYLNQNPFCEPQLGKRGLYRSIGGDIDVKALEFAMLWVLNLSDGKHDLLAIAERSGLPFQTISAVSDQLRDAGLLTETDK